MAQKYGQLEYEAAGKEKGLKYLGTTYPLSTVASDWECLHCGRKIHKSLRSVMKTPVGDRCQSGNTLQAEKYTALAALRGITWAPKDGVQPSNTKVPTRWLLPNGDELISTYYDLAYKGKMPNRIKKALGLPYRRRGGATNV